MNESILNKDEIRQLIPHAGDMCLIDAVNNFNATEISCQTNTHKLIDNPLRHNDTLAAVNLIEYGAQCMAIHGGLQARERGESLGQGYLVSVRNVILNIERIDELENNIHITASQIMANAGSMMYEFSASHNDSALAQGRVTVMRVV